MTVRDLLPVLPRYPDDSGYDVQILYRDKHFWYEDFRRPNSNVDIANHRINLPYDCPFKTIDDILDAWVIRLEAGRPLAGGHWSDALAVYVLPPDRKEK